MSREQQDNRAKKITMCYSISTLCLEAILSDTESDEVEDDSINGEGGYVLLITFTYPVAMRVNTAVFAHKVTEIPPIGSTYPFCVLLSVHKHESAQRQEP